LERLPVLVVFFVDFRKKGRLYGATKKRRSVTMTELKPGEKYLLKIHDAAAYYSIGIKKMRRLCEEGEGIFAFCSGNYWLIARPKFEEFLEEKYLSGQKQYKNGMMEEEDPEK
jgi:hypothetical protein